MCPAVYTQKRTPSFSSKQRGGEGNKSKSHYLEEKGIKQKQRKQELEA
jgi:hypothetical protein